MRLGLLVSLFVHGGAGLALALFAVRAAEPAPEPPLAVSIRAIEVPVVEPSLRVRDPLPEPPRAESWDAPPEEPALEIEPPAEPPRIDARAAPSRAVRLPRSLRPAATPPPPPAPAPARIAPAPAPTARARAAEVRPPRLLADASPRARYPGPARRMGLEGTVTLLLHVGADGAVARVEIAVSSGHPELDRAAADAAARWRFEPAQQDGRPVAYDVRAPVEFRLADA